MELVVLWQSLRVAAASFYGNRSQQQGRAGGALESVAAAKRTASDSNPTGVPGCDDQLDRRSNPREGVSTITYS
jgi:hypothetical protein